MFPRNSTGVTCASVDLLCCVEPTCSDVYTGWAKKVRSQKVSEATNSFNKIVCCDYDILRSYLSDRPEVLYNLRKRHHNRQIHKIVDLNDRDFLVRNFYKNLFTETLA